MSCIMVCECVYHSVSWCASVNVVYHVCECVVYHGVRVSCIMVCECVVYHGVRVCRVSWCASVSCIMVCECDVVYHGVRV